MSDWQPTEAQIEAAMTAYDEVIDMPFISDAQADWKAMRAAITAYLTALDESAHAAVDPVDTTEFDAAIADCRTATRALQDVVRKTYHVNPTEAEVDMLDEASVKMTRAEKALINLYVKAAAR